jgi:hypothetical protein
MTLDSVINIDIGLLSTKAGIRSPEFTAVKQTFPRYWASMRNSEMSRMFADGHSSQPQLTTTVSPRW